MRMGRTVVRTLLSISLSSPFSLWGRPCFRLALLRRRAGFSSRRSALRHQLGPEWEAWIKEQIEWLSSIQTVTLKLLGAHECGRVRGNAAMAEFVTLPDPVYGPAPSRGELPTAVYDVISNRVITFAGCTSNWGRQRTMSGC